MKRPEFYKSPLSGFLVCDMDSDGEPKYYGYENLFGHWIIIKETTESSLVYAYGTSGYTAAWTARAEVSTTYSLPSVAFTALLD